MTPALLTVIAAAEEKSKTVFYIFAAAAAAWAVIGSFLGFTRPNFPGDARGRAAVMLITLVVVVGTMATAVITA
jgi:hypothetical protein